MEMRLNLNEVKYDQTEFTRIELYTTLECSRTVLFELIIKQVFRLTVC